VPALRFCSALVIGVLSLFSGVMAENAPASAPAVNDVAVEKVGGATYFHVSINWPAEGVPEDYTDFKLKSRTHREYGGWTWPAEALALVPQDKTAWLVYPRYPEPGQVSREVALLDLRVLNRLPNPAVFVGKLREPGRQQFLLRCPTVQGKWSYLPVTIDFDKAAARSGLAKECLEAQADFMAIMSTSDGRSFFTYARERLRSRLGRVPQSRPTEEWMIRQDSTERLYEVTTGALALQESLQLDRMRNAQPDTGARDIPIDKIQGVAIRSHPWTDMIGSRQPKIERIAAMVPEDQYYVRFTTTRSLADFLDFADSWAGSLLGFAEVSGQDYGVRQKLEEQICLRSSWLSKLLGPLVIESLVLTGSDPYVREGSDLSVIFQVKARPVFERAVARYLEEARGKRPDLQQGQDAYENVTIERFATADGGVRCFRAWLDEFCVYSNSPIAVRRIIDAYHGRRPSLAKSLDFVYMRTVYPLGAREEDGFVFLSDPFIRAIVGPRIRVAEKRRLEVLTSLEMMKNAALLYLWERPGEKVPSIEELYNGGYLDPKHVQTEPGDRLSWDPAAFVARSERYGRFGHLTPICELTVDRVTTQEKANYETFRDRYQDYWRRYFDPIGIRVTTGTDINLAVTVLPLIDRSEYNEMKRNFGGKAIALSSEPVHEKAVIRLAAHLNPESPMLRQIQTSGLNFLPTDLPGDRQAAVQWIGERLQFWIEDSDAILPVVREEQYASLFQVPIVLGIEVKNPLGLMTFLAGLQGFIRVSSPNTVVFDLTEPYKGFAFTRIRPMPESPLVGEQGGDSSLKDAEICYGKIGRWLYVSTSQDALRRIVDHMPSTRPASEPTSTAATGATTPASSPADNMEGHMAMSFHLDRAVKSRQALLCAFGKQAWQAEWNHMRNLWLLAHTVGLGPEATVPPETVLGYSIQSALGNRYRYDPARDEIIGSATGSPWNPALTVGDVPADAPLARLMGQLRSLGACLKFTDDGLRTEVNIRRVGR